MINQTAIFIDAGFLLSVGGHRVADTTLRNAVKVQYSTLVKGLTKEVRLHSGTHNLRTYWYDASKDGLLTDEQKRIALIPDVKVRLGRLNYFGEQKGVDLRLALDLVGLARTGAASVAYLASGDDDLTEAVEEAQSLGLKVVLLGLKDDSSRLGYSSVADHLAVTVDSIVPIPESLLITTFTRAYEADETHVRTTSAIASADTRPAVEGQAATEGQDGASTQPANPTFDAPITPSTVTISKPKPSSELGTSSASEPRTTLPPSPSALATRVNAPKPAASAPSESPSIVYSSRSGEPGSYQGLSAHEQEVVEVAERIGAQVARTWYASITQSDLNEMLADRPLLPPDIDRVLLKDCAQAIGEQDTYLQSVRRTLRWAFWAEIDNIQ